MLAHKLILDDVADQPFILVALHCSVEDYKLAFLLNKYLHLQLARARKDIDYYKKSSQALFAFYEFRDLQHYCNYYLVKNKCMGQSMTSGSVGSLFGNEEWGSGNSYLLPEFQKVDFFLKIEEEDCSVPEKIILDRIKQIPHVATAYLVEGEQIKSKQNLIFD